MAEVHERLGRPAPGVALGKLNLVKSKSFAQPNLLADRHVVGEHLWIEFASLVGPRILISSGKKGVTRLE